MIASLVRITDGDYLTGVDIYDSYNCGTACSGDGVPGWLTIGGTSLSSPLIAAVYAHGGAKGVAPPRRAGSSRIKLISSAILLT